MAEVIDDLAHQLRHLTRLGLVRLEGDSTHALALQLTHQGFRFVGRVDVAKGNVRAVFGEGPCDRCADAARTAGDESDFACEFAVHECLLVLIRLHARTMDNSATGINRLSVASLFLLGNNVSQ